MAAANAVQEVHYVSHRWRGVGAVGPDAAAGTMARGGAPRLGHTLHPAISSNLDPGLRPSPAGRTSSGN